MLIAEFNKGKTTFDEILRMDVGLMHYLWVRAMKENKIRQDASNKNNSILDVLGDI